MLYFATILENIYWQIYEIAKNGEDAKLHFATIECAKFGIKKACQYWHMDVPGIGLNQDSELMAFMLDD